MMTPAEGAATDRLAHGEAVPGGPGACGRCHHAKVWHSATNRTHPCELCECPSFAVPAAAALAAAELAARRLAAADEPWQDAIRESEGALFYMAPADRLF